MDAPTGKLTGIGEVRGPDGKVKGTITFEADATPAQVAAVTKTLEESDNGSNAPDSDS